jgi:hypothetical protein
LLVSELSNNCVGEHIPLFIVIMVMFCLIPVTQITTPLTFPNTQEHTNLNLHYPRIFKSGYSLMQCWHS